MSSMRAAHLRDLGLAAARVDLRDVPPRHADNAACQTATGGGPETFASPTRNTCSPRWGIFLRRQRPRVRCVRRSCAATLGLIPGNAPAARDGDVTV